MISSRLPEEPRRRTRSRARSTRATRGARGALDSGSDRDQPDPRRIQLSRRTARRRSSNPRALDYDPQPLGLWSARAAVAADFRRRGIVISADRVALTSSTSEAYALLFKLLCDAGDAVLVPHPSYPLFEHLTQLESVDAIPYSLEYHGSWRIDVDSVRAPPPTASRALLIVSPNNPTGSFLHRDDLDGVSSSPRPRLGNHRRRSVCRLPARSGAGRDQRARRRRGARHSASAAFRNRPACRS